MPIAVQPTAVEANHGIKARKSTTNDKDLQVVPGQADFDPILLSLLWVSLESGPAYSRILLIIRLTALTASCPSPRLWAGHYNRHPYRPTSRSASTFRVR